MTHNCTRENFTRVKKCDWNDDDEVSEASKDDDDSNNDDDNEDEDASSFKTDEMSTW